MPDAFTFVLTIEAAGEVTPAATEEPTEPEPEEVEK